MDVAGAEVGAATEPMAAVQRPSGASAPAKASVATRVGAVLAALGCAAILGIGAWLTPSADGHGSHMQLGLPPCPWVLAFHRPCPTCGMTTAVSEAAHGHLVRSFLTQPFGFLVALGAALGLLVNLHIAATGSHLGRLAGGLMTPRILWILAGLAGAAWAYKWVTWPQS